ncbi:hypothetical protein Thein_1976 [Thermodesulfatator indicus DSM 15286]|uniref:Uncharacterized protein n=1 Tax=Thermodesulfatator indicus (strain DSM 15286 / JCM 11887 / CIR29812) TaxID=667014 RepID=F8ACQ1_THEID|nr:hypothetical protein [Thermodesulfatator indicus]AEH45830.1 hypothetical protein Thein_1976 [Thermodesulfatator indicus DSM 15286]
MSIENAIAQTISLGEARVNLAEKVALVNEIALALELSMSHLARACILIKEEIEPVYGREVADRIYEICGLDDGRKLAEYIGRFGSLSPQKRREVIRSMARATIKELGLGR